MKLPFSPCEYRKLVVAAVTFLAFIVSAGVLHGTAEVVANGLLAAAGTLGVGLVPNKPPVARAKSWS